MIYITGDTHGSQDYFKLHIFAGEHGNLTKDDYVIIAGDFGGVWNTRTLAADLKPYTELPFTVLFVDGNHENFDLLNEFPVEEWHGGKVHRIKENIIHLMRGQIFEIEGKTFFTFGGATSIDRFMRREGISWWRGELPTKEELEEGVKNLEKHGNKVDFIVTHSCGERALSYPEIRRYAALKLDCPECKMLTRFEDTVDFKRWYFGHFHADAEFGGRYVALMDEVREVK